MEETIPNGQSADIVDENILQLKQPIPEVYTEESLDFDKLKVVLVEYVDDVVELHNFTWWGKSNPLRLAQTPSTKTLRPCPEVGKNLDATQNLFIEVDTLAKSLLLSEATMKPVRFWQMEQLSFWL